MWADDFSFSQGNLQAYVDCNRRFWLAYIEQLPWPAVEAAPVQQHEQFMRQGQLFHRLVERTEIGLAPEQVAAEVEPPVADWYAEYLAHPPANLPTGFIEIEKALSIPLASSRLAARYDKIAVEPDGRAVIVDWKTGRRRPRPATLRQRLQSIVYPFVLVEASAALPWGPVRPEQVEMVYWFTAEPTEPITFRYDGAQHEASRRLLEGLIGAIRAGQSEADFPKVEDTEENRRNLCGFCVYRSRCDRGEAAQDFERLDEPADAFGGEPEASLDFSMADVEELAF